jgi:hypothetical protein
LEHEPGKELMAQLGRAGLDGEAVQRMGPQELSNLLTGE